MPARVPSGTSAISTRAPRACTAAPARSSGTSSPTGFSACRRGEMDLQLTDEQRWLADTVDELLARANGDGVWPSLVEFGALEVGEDGLGAVELALIARGLGAGLATVPFAETAAVRYAVDLDGATAAPCLSE